MSAGGPAGIPDGFAPMAVGGDFMKINGPIYARHEGAGLRMGFRVEARHCNPFDICHGGMMASFCDMLLPMTAHKRAPEVSDRFLPTISLQVDYLGPSPLGSWVEGEGQVLRVTRNMVFAQGLVTADGQPVARVSGVFKIGPVFASPLGPQA